MEATLAIIIPCLDEAEGILPLLAQVDGAITGLGERCLVVIVDDGSVDDTAERARTFTPSTSDLVVNVISLSYTMGHQEAIQQGLLCASESRASHFIVMDGDGEDDPAALPELIGAKGTPIVFVARGRRHEAVGFRLGYRLYRMLFRWVVGKPINFGNYSMIDRRVLAAVLDRGFLHYAAFLARLGPDYGVITRDRRPRIAGRSKMSFQALSRHAFNAIIEYSDEVLALFLKGSFYLGGLFLCCVITIVCIKVFTDLAIPGWASILTFSLVNSMLLCLGFFVIGLMLARAVGRRERSARRIYERVL